VSLSLLNRFRNSLSPRLRRAGPRELRLGLCAERVFLSTGQEVQARAAEENAPAWMGAVQALPELFAACAGKETSIIVADQFVRYALLPWSDTLKTHEQWLGLARHRFTAIHGPVAADWEIKFAETAPAGPRLACAVDRTLVDALAAASDAHAVNLVSVQPFLVAAFNRLREGVIPPGGSCWLVVEEPGRLTLALFLRGVWATIRSRRADWRWRRVLPEIIERESAFLGLEEPCTRVVVCAQGAFDVEEHESFRLDAVNYQELALSV
jgi:hypothetical protein